MYACRLRDPRLLERHLHRFVNTHWSRRVRLLCLLSHYRFMLARLPAPLFEAIYVNGEASLGELVMKDGRVLTLSLRPSIFKGCEGELGLVLSNAEGRVLYRLVFTVIDDGSTLAIGCLQGPDGADSRDMVRDLTRQMHGLRPKQLMLSLAYAFAKHGGIGHILAVGNDAHPLRRRGRRFQADYDAFWQEQKGVQGDDGWFLLPATLDRKTEADVPSHHRSAFRRREAMRAEADRLLTLALGEGASGNLAMDERCVGPRSEPMPRLSLEVAWIP